jgi:hypothetical protein
MAMFTRAGVGRALGCGLLLVVLTGCGHSRGDGSEPGVSSAPPTPVTVPATSASVPDRQPHTLVLNATGTGKVLAMTYTLDKKVVRRGAVKLPWRESITVPADGRPHSWTLEVEFTGGGNVSLAAIFNGQVAAKGGSAGSGNARGSATVGGTVNG